MSDPNALIELPTLVGSAGGGIDMDLSSIIGAVLFLAVMALLNTLLFKPYLEIVSKRRALTEGALDDAEDLAVRAEAAASEYETKLAEARAEATEIREALKAEGREQEQALLAEARKAAEAELASARSALEMEMAVAERQLEAQASALSTAIVNRVAQA